MTDQIIMYSSRFCSHSWLVERFLKSNDVPVTMINIDRNQEAREEVKSLNRGYASVPTLIFPDGTLLTEPSIGQLRAKLGLESTSLLGRLKSFFDG